MNEEVERKLYEDWLHQSPEFADTIISAWDVWLGRAALAQPEPAAPSEDRPLFDPEYPDSGYCTNAEWAARKSAQAAAPTVVEPLIGCVGHDCAECQARADAAPRAALTVDEAIHALSSALAESKGWLRDYSDAVIRDAIDRREPRAALTREQAIALWADKSDGPSNSEIVSYCRAIEAAHGVGGPK